MISLKEAQENCSLEKTIEVRSNNHHQSKDDEVKPRKSKKARMIKMFSTSFLTYFLENESPIYYEAILCPRTLS